MGYELRMPSITAPTEREQLGQIKSYLYQLIPQLQWALDSLDAMVASNSAAPKIQESTIPAQQSPWLSLGLSEDVSESEAAVGRRGDTGCHYRACEGGRHIYVAFNCAFTFSGDMIQVNADNLPTAYRPDRDIYAMCAVECSSGERAIARVLVTPSGKVLVDWVQLLIAPTEPETPTVKWIDGYIDYWT